MNKNSLKYAVLALTLLTPVVSFAALDGLKSLLLEFKGLLNDSIAVLFGLALVFFFWGLGQFILKAGEQKSRDEGKQKMIWGIVAIFVFLSIYGIVAFLGTLISIPQNQALVPQGTVLPPGDTDPCPFPGSDNGDNPNC